MQRRVKVKIVDNKVHIEGLPLRDLVGMLESLKDVEVEIQVTPNS